jgi:ribosomal subunit interface protein
MKLPIELSGQGVTITEALREHAARRMAFALRRFEHRIERVEVRLERQAGNVERRCSVRVRLRGMPTVHVTQVASVEYAALDRAADRIRHTVARRLARRLTPPRGSVSAI